MENIISFVWSILLFIWWILNNSIWQYIEEYTNIDYEYPSIKIEKLKVDEIDKYKQLVAYYNSFEKFKKVDFDKIEKEKKYVIWTLISNIKDIELQK